MQDNYDLVIVGGGLAGNCLALALQHSGLKIAIVEAIEREKRRSSPAGDRALALAQGTVTMLDALDAWQGVQNAATAIKTIHISDQGHFGKTRLFAEKENVDALGYVITARDIENHIADCVDRSGIDQICPGRVLGLMSGPEQVGISLKLNETPITIEAKLLVGADGGQSTVRQLLDIEQQVVDYQQTAIVTTVRTTLPHLNTAFERFTASGPLALLPVQKNRMAVVWTRTTEDAERLITCAEAQFIKELQACFGYRLGELFLDAPRRAFPLQLIRAKHMHSGRCVIVGNAVHQLHPVAGQGFNLGLRDVVQLAEMLLQQYESGKDIGAQVFLNDFCNSREQDHDRVILFTDNLVKTFSNDWFPVAAARNAGLLILDHIAAAKSRFALHAMGLADRLPRIGHRRVG